MDGHHYATTRMFVEVFNGKWSRVANLVMQDTKDLIIATCNLLNDDERWFKNKIIT
jgi:hypothetical protein